MSWAEAKWIKDGILGTLAVEKMVPSDDVVKTLLDKETAGGDSGAPVLLGSFTADVTCSVRITVNYHATNANRPATLVVLPRERTSSDSFQINSSGEITCPSDTVWKVCTKSTTYVTDKKDVDVEEGVTYYFYGYGNGATSASYSVYYNLLTVGYENTCVLKGGLKVGGIQGNVSKYVSTNSSTHTLIDLKGSGYVEVYLRGSGATDYGTKLSVKVDGIEKNTNNSNAITIIGNHVVVYDIEGDKLSSSNHGVSADTYGGISTQFLYPMIFSFSSSFTIEISPTSSNNYIGAKYVIRYFLTE